MPLTDADLMQGGPGDRGAAGAAPAATQGGSAPAPQTVKVRLGGVEHDVPVELARAWKQERDRMAGEYGSRIQSYEQRLAALESDDTVDEEPVQQGTGIQPPNPKDLIKAIETGDHDAVNRYHEATLRWQESLVVSAAETLEARRAEERQAEQNANEQNANWNRYVSQFYKDNPELRGNEDIVDAVWRNNFKNLKDLSPEEGFNELARLSKDRIVRLTESGKRQTARRAPTLETSAGARQVSRPQPEEEIEEPAPGGLGRAIREKSRRFRNPNFARASGE